MHIQRLWLCLLENHPHDHFPSFHATTQTHNRHTTDTCTHTFVFFAERICDSPKSPGSALVAQSIASRITGFRHVTTSLSWDRSKRRPARSYGLQLDERASTMVLGSAGGPPRGLAVFALLHGELEGHQADPSTTIGCTTCSNSSTKCRDAPDLGNCTKQKHKHLYKNLNYKNKRYKNLTYL